jgi:hypothetical protein
MSSPFNKSILGIDAKLLFFVIISFLSGRQCDVYFESSFPKLGILLPLIGLMIIYQIKKDLNTTSDEQ